MAVRSPWLLCPMVAMVVGCVNHGNATGGGGSATPTPYPNLEKCYNDPSNPPSGYIRIGSKAGGLAGCPQTAPDQLNVYIYARYDNKPVGSQMLVCAVEVIPTGWQDISGSYHDGAGCDYQAHPDTFANVRLIYRAQ
jgi:hypothetical protein